MTHPGRMVRNKAIKNEVCRNSEGRSKARIEQGQQFLSLSGTCKVACSGSSWGWQDSDQRIVQVWGVDELELRSQLYYLQAVWPCASDVAFPRFSSSSIILVLQLNGMRYAEGVSYCLSKCWKSSLHYFFLCPPSSLICEKLNVWNQGRLLLGG